MYIPPGPVKSYWPLFHADAGLLGDVGHEDVGVDIGECLTDRLLLQEDILRVKGLAVVFVPHSELAHNRSDNEVLHFLGVGKAERVDEDGGHNAESDGVLLGNGNGVVHLFTGFKG